MISIREISAIVREYPADYRPTEIEPLGSAGGMSGAQFWRIESKRGTLVLRRWPTEHPSRERLQFIHRVLFRAAENGITFLAVPIRASSSESFLSHGGWLWELTQWMPGAADYEQSPNEQKLAAAMTALAKFHLAVSDFRSAASQPKTSVPPAISRHLSRLQVLANGGIEELSQAISKAEWPEFGTLAHIFLAVFPEFLPRVIGLLIPLANAALPVQPCLRDIWHDHVLFTGNEVTGIIDFGAVDFDTPETDISRLLGSLAGDDAAGWRAGLDAYSTIRPLTADEERAAKALDVSGTILAGCNWIRWICIEGRQFDDRAKTLDRFRRIVARCAFAAKR